MTMKKSLLHCETSGAPGRIFEASYGDNIIPEIHTKDSWLGKYMRHKEPEKKTKSAKFKNNKMHNNVNFTAKITINNDFLALRIN